MSWSSVDLKRQLLISAESEPVRKIFEPLISRYTEGELIEIGKSLKAMSDMGGWHWLEAYMLGQINLPAYLETKEEDPTWKGMARGYSRLIQLVQYHVKLGEKLEQKEKAKHEAKNVPEDKTNEGV